MSILTRPLFGRVSDAPPLSPVGVRCARLRAARGLDGFRWSIVGWGIANAAIAMIFGVFTVLMRPGTAGPGSIAGVALRMIRGMPLSSLAILVLFFVVAYFVGPLISRVMFDRSVDRLTFAHTFRARRVRRSARTVVIIMASIVGLAGLASLTVSLGFGLTSLVTGLAYGGGFLIPFGIFNRRGVRLVCARCDYPMSTWLGSPGVCPECGAAWKEPWRARLGERRRRPGLIALGAAMLALSMVLAAVGAWMM